MEMLCNVVPLMTVEDLKHFREGQDGLQCHTLSWYQDRKGAGVMNEAEFEEAFKTCCAALRKMVLARGGSPVEGESLFGMTVEGFQVSIGYLESYTADFRRGTYEALRAENRPLQELKRF